MSEPTDPIAAQIGRRVRDRRLELGLSQVDLARRLGVTYQQVQKYERGTNRIAADRLHGLAQILDVPISYFYSDDGTPPGLAEAAAGYELEALSGEHGSLDEEAVLIDAFRRIRDRRVRRRLLALVEVMAGPSPRDLAEDG